MGGRGRNRREEGGRGREGEVREGWEESAGGGSKGAGGGGKGRVKRREGGGGGRRELKNLSCAGCQYRLMSYTVKQKPRLNPAVKYKPISKLGIFALSLPITCFGLGCWQYQRRKWKLGLLDKIEERAHLPPIDLPHSVEELQSDAMEFCPVRLTGEFIHKMEIQVGFRPSHHPELNPSQANKLGVYILTPFRVKDSDLTVIVNRGWVPLNFRSRHTRSKGNVEGEVTITGLVVNGERKVFFARDNPDPSKRWFWSRKAREEIASYLGVDPVIIDSDIKSTFEGGPIGGQTNLKLRNKHLDYMLTWWLFALTGGVIWYKKFIHGGKLGKEFISVMKHPTFRK
ncbi:hypothetical protein FSP39_018165 [Pinctada imbricata]|uniref:SURF1-like protein n=1 Tax=Pinctada imbricata TaxID=66713 RepID=A0AA89BRG5_PINIB|nr:hypothetical protein FSP39_018165 [Pinctada imbricata]